jgi:aminoglycoside 2'-N-acetyltransferase I
MAHTSESRFEVRKGSDLSTDQQVAILSLCTVAYEEDFQPFLTLFTDPTHVLVWSRDLLVSHLLWITRWLQIDDGCLLCTAYIEAVATDPAFRSRGLASEAMRIAVETIAQDDRYAITALSPSDVGFYTRLGWEQWRGPLFARTEAGLIAMPDDEEAMIYRLPTTPEIDLVRPLSIEWRALEVW